MRSRQLAFVACVLVAVLILAGCTLPINGDKASSGAATRALSPVTFTNILDEGLPMTMDDGVTLSTWVYRPDAPAGEKFPIILQTSPYFGNSDPEVDTRGQKFSQWLIDYFVPRGYVVVLQSVRGTGTSQGCFSMGGPREMKDHYDVVEQLAKEPWSNGKIGMIGKSYRGTTPHMAAVLNPPHLTTIVPIAGITDWYWYTFTHGAAYSTWVGFNALYDVSVGWNGFDQERLTSDARHWPGRACEDTANLVAEEGRFHASGDYTQFYKERNYAKDVDKMTASVYLIHGFQDWNVKPDQFGDWYAKVKAPKKALLGQMDHEYPLRADWGEHLLRWFDYWLKGVQNGVMDEAPVLVEDNLGRWRAETTWPPARAQPTIYQLDAGAKLVGDGASQGTLTYLGSPHEQPDPKVDKQTQLRFQSEPLATDLHTAGTPELSFTASATAPNTQLNALLYEVTGDAWTLVNCAALDARHRDSLEQGAPLTPGQDAQFNLRFHPQDHVFRAGSQVGLVLAGANPAWIHPEATSEVVTVTAGPTAQLRLPSVATITLEAPQPTMKPGHELPWTSAETPEDSARKLPPCLVG